MKRNIRRRLASAVYPWHIPMVDQLSANALLAAWQKKHEHVPVYPTREALYQHLADNVIGPAEPIDYLEFGVYRGESLRNWTDINKHPASRFFGFDSFKGLPEDWGRCPASRFDVGGEVPVIRDDRVEFVIGWFQKTMDAFLDSFRPANRIVINNDSDLYSSTLYVLAKLDRLTKPGTILIFDEFNSALHEFRAMHDYLSAFGRKATPIARADDEHGRIAFLFE